MNMHDHIDIEKKPDNQEKTERQKHLWIHCSMSNLGVVQFLRPLQLTIFPPFVKQRLRLVLDQRQSSVKTPIKKQV